MDTEIFSIGLGVSALLKDGADGFCLLLGLAFFFFSFLLLGCWVLLFPPFNCALTLFLRSGEKQLGWLARI
jgi:hypothetical protein